MVEKKAGKLLIVVLFLILLNMNFSYGDAIIEGDLSCSCSIINSGLTSSGSGGCSLTCYKSNGLIKEECLDEGGYTFKISCDSKVSDYYSNSCNSGYVCKELGITNNIWDTSFSKLREIMTVDYDTNTPDTVCSQIVSKSFQGYGFSQSADINDVFKSGVYTGNGIDSMCCGDDRSSRASCSALGWEGKDDICWNTKLPDADYVKHENSDGDYEKGCSGRKNHEQAKDFCESVGARLCSVSEIKETVKNEAECGYENQYLWTDDKEGNQYYVVKGNGNSEQAINPESTNIGGNYIYAICCADKNPDYYHMTSSSNDEDFQYMCVNRGDQPGEEDLPRYEDSNEYPNKILFQKNLASFLPFSVEGWMVCDAAGKYKDSNIYGKWNNIKTHVKSENEVMGTGGVDCMCPYSDMCSEREQGAPKAECCEMTGYDSCSEISVLSDCATCYGPSVDGGDGLEINYGVTEDGGGGILRGGGTFDEFLREGVIVIEDNTDEKSSCINDYSGYYCQEPNFRCPSGQEFSDQIFSAGVCCKQTCEPTFTLMNSVMNMNFGSKYICYQKGGQSLISECCSSFSGSDCYNQETHGDGDLKTSELLVVGEGGQLNQINSYDYVDENEMFFVDFGIVNKIINNKMQFSSDENDISYYIRANTEGFDSIQFFYYVNGTLPSDKNNRLDVINNLKDILVEIYFIGGYLNKSLGEITEKKLRFGKWLKAEMSVPEDSKIVKINFYIPSNSIINDYLGEIKVDNLALIENSFEKQNYCTPTQEWVVDVDPIETITDFNITNVGEWFKYKWTCDLNLAYGWSGTKCCGDDKQEYYSDTEAGCFGGYPIKSNRVVESIIQTIYQFEEDEDPVYEKGSIMFYNQSFRRCNGDKKVQLNRGLMELSDNEYTNESFCDVQGNFFCSYDRDYYESVSYEKYVDGTVGFRNNTKTLSFGNLIFDGGFNDEY